MADAAVGAAAHAEDLRADAVERRFEARRADGTRDALLGGALGHRRAIVVGAALGLGATRIHRAAVAVTAIARMAGPARGTVTPVIPRGAAPASRERRGDGADRRHGKGMNAF